MATIDGLNTITCDELDSNVILYTGNLNGISPSVFNNIAGSTSNLQTQINSLSGGGGSGSFSNIIVSNDASFNRVNVKGKFSVNYLNPISVPALEVVCPSGVPSSNYIGLYANIYGSPLANDGGFVFQDNNLSQSGSFTLQDYTGRSYCYINENAESGISCPRFYFNSSLVVYSYNRSAYPALTYNKEVFQVYTDGVNGSSDGIYINAPFNSRNSGFTFIDNYSATQGGGGLSLQDNAGRTYFYVNEAVNSVLTTPLMSFNSSFTVNSYDRSAYPTLTFNKKVFEVYTDGTTGTTDQVNIFVPTVCSKDIKVNGLTIGVGGTSYVASSYNTCFGVDCLKNYINTTNNTSCCAIGNSVLKNCVSGTSNTVVSNYAGMYDNVSGSWNVAVGNRALEKSLSNSNTAVGDGAGGFLVNGNNLTTTGYYSGRSIISGVYNCSYGSYSYNGTDFSYSCAFGAFSTITGDYGVALGYGASAGSHEIMLGTSSEKVICPNSLSVKNGLSFDSTTSANNKITNLNKITFDGSVGATADKIVLWNGGNQASSYVLGVNSSILYYTSPGNHNFYSGGTSTTPLLTLNSTLTTIGNQILVNGAISTSIGVVYKDQQAVGHTGVIEMNGNTLYIHSKNDTSTTTPTYATGMKFTCNNAEKVEQTVFSINVNSVEVNGGLYVSGASSAVFWNDITTKGYFTQTYQNGESFNILSRNDYYTGVGSPLATTINLYCCNSSRAQIPAMVINTTNTSITGTLIVSNSYGGSYNAKLFQDIQYLYLRSSNNGYPVSSTRTAISLQVMTSTQAVVEPMTLTTTEIQTIVPIQPNYASLPSFSSYQIGGQILGTYMTPTFTSGSTKSIFSLTLPMGVWIVNAILMVGATAFSSYKSVISSTINQVVFVDAKSISELNGINSSLLSFNMSATIQISTSTTYYITLNVNYTGTFSVNNTSTSCFMATRIA